MKVFWIVLGSFFGLAAVTSGSISGFVLVGALSGLFFWLAFRKRKERAPRSKRTTTPPASRARVKQPTVKQPKAKKPSYPPTAEHAAVRLRAVATSYDNPQEDAFFRIDRIEVTRRTKSTNVSGPGTLMIGRGGVYVGFYNARAQQPKLKEYKKQWSQTIGVLPNRFELYLSDHSSFDFAPQNAEDFLVLSAFWQVFNDGLNGRFDLIQNPAQSGLGDRLRQVAEYIDTHRAECANGAIDVEASLGEAEVVLVDRPSDAFEPQGVGSVLEGWKLTQKLGNGQFGDVYLAEFVEDPTQRAAVKLMQTPPGIKPGTPQFMAAAEVFLNEGYSSFNFSDSAYVLAANGLNQQPWPWIRYPFVAGSTTQALIAADAMNTDDWWNLAHDLLSALDSIHSEGLVHKDIKQDNVMHAGDRFVILDLGISTVSGYEMFGSGRYLPSLSSPEVLESVIAQAGNTLETFTPKSDVFAAGLLLYSCLKADNPWPVSRESNDPSFRLEQLRTQAVDFSGLPTDVAALLRQMLELNPKKRPSARTLLFEVEPHINIEQKLQQVDDAWSAWLARAGESDEDEIVQEGMFGGDKTGPFESWAPLEEFTREIVEDLRPSWFTITAEFFDEREELFVQAMYASGGWQAECSADSFTEASLSDAQKMRFVRLGWRPPTTSDPNFSRDVDDVTASSLQKIFVAAFEQGYLIRPGEISRLTLKAENRGAY